MPKLSRAMLAYRNWKGFPTAQHKDQDQRCPAQKPRRCWGIVCKKGCVSKGHAQKGWVQQKNNLTCLKELNHSTTTACKYRKVLPSQGEGAIRTCAHPSPFFGQRIKFLLCLTEISLILLAWRTLGRRTLVWVSDTEGSVIVPDCYSMWKLLAISSSKISNMFEIIVCKI